MFIFKQVGGILSVANVVCKTDPRHHLTATPERGQAGTLASSITGNTACFLTSNVNFSFKAAGTHAAHRLSLVPIPETGQLALENKLRGEERNLCHLTNTMCQNVFPFALTEVLEDLEKQSTHPAYFSLFFNKYFKILIYNGDCEQNSSAGADGPEEVGQHRQGANAQAAERSCGGDVPRRQNSQEVEGMVKRQQAVIG